MTTYAKYFHLKKNPPYFISLDASDRDNSRDQACVMKKSSDAPKGIIGGIPATDAPKEYSMN